MEPVADRVKKINRRLPVETLSTADALKEAGK